ncbi:Signal transducing adapter molecule 1 [Trichinella papuae]|uniref:Signal transducing adapter molecule 1 n=1 Tax=Trichinella papuae TaxID=268474 RepID=A0A0V1MSR9_9BILA|nr:Signal transducing adapter molecule 1 [Trichinella papuae]
MPLNLFSSSSSPFDAIVERATSHKLTSLNWAIILEICDQVSRGDSRAAKDCLLSIRKRLNHRDPHVVMLALTVLDSCISNCGRNFKEEVCTSEFINELNSKATGSNRLVGERVRGLIKRWRKEEAGVDYHMEPMRVLYADLERQGYEFPPLADSVPKKTYDEVAIRKEEEDLAKAIDLSLKDIQRDNADATSNHKGNKYGTVKALYDFEAAEENELSFLAGELITVTDDDDPNWWRGMNHRGEGFFPASFVTDQLNTVVEKPERKKSVSFDENEKLVNCLIAMQDLDPTGERPDPPETRALEERCLSMAQAIEKELEAIDREHNQLVEVNSRLLDALTLYHSAMNEVTPFQTVNQLAPPQIIPSISAVLPTQTIMYTPNDMPSNMSSMLQPETRPSGCSTKSNFKNDVFQIFCICNMLFTFLISVQTTNFIFQQTNLFFQTCIVGFRFIKQFCKVTIFSILILSLSSIFCINSIKRTLLRNVN